MQPDSSQVVRRLAMVMGVACATIGVVHLVGGVTSVPGEGSAGATIDSRERFYGAVFAGYGLAWIMVARQGHINRHHVRLLAAVMLIGGGGRLVSLVVEGWPQWFQTVLTGVELVVPLLFIALTGGEREFPDVRPFTPVHDRSRLHPPTLWKGR